METLQYSLSNGPGQRVWPCECADFSPKQSSISAWPGLVATGRRLGRQLLPGSNGSNGGARSNGGNGRGSCVCVGRPPCRMAAERMSLRLPQTRWTMASPRTAASLPLRSSATHRTRRIRGCGRQVQQGRREGMATGFEGRGKAAAGRQDTAAHSSCWDGGCTCACSSSRLGALQVPMWPLIENGQESMMVRCCASCHATACHCSCKLLPRCCPAGPLSAASSQCRCWSFAAPLLHCRITAQMTTTHCTTCW